MKVIVLDACVAVKWYIHEEQRELALGLLEDRNLVFIAPDIFGPEVVNALLKNHREGHLTDSLLERALFDLTATSPQPVSTIVLMDRAIEIARAARHGIYDCLYLSLAERWDVDLVTADREFAQRCRTRLSDRDLARRVVTLGEFVKP